MFRSIYLKTVSTTVLFAMLLLQSPTAWSCSMASEARELLYLSVEQRYQSANTVVLATLDTLKTKSNRDIVSFSVSKVWKGNSEKTLTAIDSLSYEVSMCGPFYDTYVKGQQYLLYITLSPKRWYWPVQKKIVIDRSYLDSLQNEIDQLDALVETQ